MKVKNFFIGGRFLLPALAAGIPIAVLVIASLSVSSQQAAAVSAVERVNAVTHKAVKPKPVVRTVEVQKGDSLSQILLNLGVNQNEVLGIIDTISSKFDPTQLQPGQKISLTFDPEVPFYLLSMVFQIDPLHELNVTRSENQSFTAAVRLRHMFIRDRAVTGTISNSLYTDGMSDGIPASVLMEMIDMYGFEVDFQRDITHGDRFGVMWQQFDDADGKPIQPGDLVLGELKLNDKTLAIYGFTGSSGRTNYFDAEGRSLRKALLKAPVRYPDITSPFGWRVNPFFGANGPMDFHRGVDFGAMPGTPIFAGGDGVVEFFGYDSIYGDHVWLKHVNGYESLYAHMEAYARGLHVGEHVYQGQVIGYVGATGEATGPHVHYEVHLWGRAVNPETLNFPPQQILKGPELNAFLIHKDRIVEKFKELTNR